MTPFLGSLSTEGFTTAPYSALFVLQQSVPNEDTLSHALLSLMLFFFLGCDSARFGFVKLGPGGRDQM